MRRLIFTSQALLYTTARSPANLSDFGNANARPASHQGYSELGGQQVGHQRLAETMASVEATEADISGCQLPLPVSLANSPTSEPDSGFS